MEIFKTKLLTVQKYFPAKFIFLCSRQQTKAYTSEVRSFTRIKNHYILSRSLHKRRLQQKDSKVLNQNLYLS